MQIVRIQALPREGFPTRPRAGRFFPSGEPTVVEIVEGDDPTIEVEKQDAAGKKYKVRQPDPNRMSRKVFDEKIMTDPVLRVLSDGETVSELSEAAMAAARKQAAELAGKLTDAEAAKATLAEELAKARKRIGELEAEVATLKAGGGGASAPDPGGAGGTEEPKPGKGSRR